MGLIGRFKGMGNVKLSQLKEGYNKTKKTYTKAKKKYSKYEGATKEKYHEYKEKIVPKKGTYSNMMTGSKKTRRKNLIWDHSNFWGK